MKEQIYDGVMCCAGLWNHATRCPIALLSPSDLVLPAMSDAVRSGFPPTKLRQGGAPWTMSLRNALVPVGD